MDSNPDENTHSLAHTIRQRDAEVVFRPSVFLNEWLLQFGGHLFYPYVLMRHGLTGANNRSFTWRWGNQALNDLMHAANIALFAAFYGTAGCSITIVEFVITELLCE